jgi:hypothetical protein
LIDPALASNPPPGELNAIRPLLLHLLSLSLCAVLVCACSGPAPTVDPGSIATAVAATLTAAAPPPASSGTVNGAICYPADRILPMTAYFQNTADNSLTALAIAEDQGRYRLQLAPGTYIAYAWQIQYQVAGSYSRAVACGLGEYCTDHSLLPFTVPAGGTLTGINLCDWSGPGGGHTHSPRRAGPRPANAGPAA